MEAEFQTSVVALGSLAESGSEPNLGVSGGDSCSAAWWGGSDGIEGKAEMS